MRSMLKFSHHIDLGCSDIADPYTNTIMFDQHTLTSHLPIVDRIGSRLWECQWMSDMSIKPTRSFSVLLPEDVVFNKVREPNKFSMYDTVKWFLNNMHPPTAGVGFSVYFYPQHDITRSFRYNANTIWPLAEKWQWVGDGDYITVHKLPDFLNDQTDRCIGPTKDLVDNLHVMTDLEVMYIDYTLGEDYIFSVLKHSKGHITYHGGMYFSAGMIGIPTLCYGFDWPDYHARWDDKIAKGSSYGQGLGNVPTKIHQYDWVNNKAIQDPQKYITHAKTVEKLISWISNL